jgi:DNA-binding beta-propeller fold protein YncE
MSLLVHLMTLAAAASLLGAGAGKLATDLEGGRIFVADSGNNRVVITDLQGRFLDAVGCGAPGLVDGIYAEAAFHRPQGLAYSARVSGLMW